MKGEKKIPIHVEDDASQEVGYRKPPKRTQFKKGQSGNPTARKRKGLDAELWNDPFMQKLSEELRIKKGGKWMTQPAIHWMIEGLRNQAIKGCSKSFKVLVDALSDRSNKGLRYLLEEKHQQVREAFLNDVQLESDEWFKDSPTADPDERR